MYAQPFLRMRSGALVHATNPVPSTIHIEDVAFGLSRRNRYACQSDLSVAQHCCEGAQLLLDRGHERTAYTFLMHDSAEYLTGDLPTPLKHSERMAGFRGIERDVEQILATKFRFDYPLPTAVKILDRQMLATEARDLGIAIIFDGEAPKALNITITPWHPEDARARFLSLFNHLAPREFHVSHACTVPASWGSR